MDKPEKKVTTDDRSIDRVEEALGVKYPHILRDKLKETNSFSWGYFTFYPVLDDEDKFHTFDDVVRENTNPQAGWRQFLQGGYAAVATDDGGYCLVLSKSKDQKVYHYNTDTGEVTLFAKNDEELKQKLDDQEKELQNLE